jgi:hypothetical protein
MGRSDLAHRFSVRIWALAKFGFFEKQVECAVAGCRCIIVERFHKTVLDDFFA